MSKSKDVNFFYRQDEVLALLHAVQSGVAYEMQYGAQDTEPKHMRTGLNNALCSHGALVRTLVEAGVIEFEDYRDNEIAMLQQEVKEYERRLSVHVNRDVKLY